MTTPQAGREYVLLPQPAFQFRSIQHEEVTVLVFEGDLEDKEAFREVLFQSRESGEMGSSEPDEACAKDLVLDLGKVTFLSEQVLAVLVEALRAQYARGAAVRLTAASAFVRKKLERTCLSKYFPIS